MANNADSLFSNDNWKTETLAQTRERLRRQWGDYPLTILIMNPINLFLVRLVGYTPITPNQISLFSFFLMAVAACLLTSLSRTVQAIGGGMLLFSYLFDCLDGDLARLKGLKSQLGAMLDPILNRFGEIVIILGITINAWRITKDPLWLICGVILMGMSQLYFYITDAMLNIFRKEYNQLDGPNKKTLFGTPVRFGAIEPFMWGQAILAFIGIAYWGVIIFGFFFTVGCIVQFYKIYSITRNIGNNQSNKFEIHVW